MKQNLVTMTSREVAELLLTCSPETRDQLLPFIIEGEARRDVHNSICKNPNCYRLHELTSQILAKLLPVVAEIKPQIDEIISTRNAIFEGKLSGSHIPPSSHYN